MAVAKTVACLSSATLNPLAPFGEADPRVGDVVAAPLRRLFVAQWQLTRPAAQSSTQLYGYGGRLQYGYDATVTCREDEEGARGELQPVTLRPPDAGGRRRRRHRASNSTQPCAPLCCVQPALELTPTCDPAGHVRRVSSVVRAGRARSSSPPIVRYDSQCAGAARRGPPAPPVSGDSSDGAE